MTPEEARALLDGTTPGPWEVEDQSPHMGGRRFIIRQTGVPGIRIQGTTYGVNSDPEIAAAAPTLAAMIAGMRTQYGVEVQRANGEWLAPYSWHDSPEQARNCVTALHGRHTANRRIIRRYVTEPEEA